MTGWLRMHWVYLVVLCMPIVSWGEDRLLFSFESGDDVRVGEGTVPAERTRLHATDGEWSLAMPLDRKEAGIGLTPVEGVLDFRGEKKLLLDVFNDGPPTSLISRVYDADGRRYVAWYYRLAPGANVVELDVYGMGQTLDLGKVSQLYFYVEEVGGRLFFDNVRLAREPFDLEPLLSIPVSHPSREANGNLLTNGDFELGLAGWGSWGEWDDGQYTFGSGEGENATSGSASLAMTCIRPGRGGVFTDPMPFPAGNYELRFWAKGSGAGAAMRWAFDGEESSKRAVLQNLEVGRIDLGDGWKEYRYAVRFGAPVVLRFYLFSIGSGTVYVDAVSITAAGGGVSQDLAGKSGLRPRKVTTEGPRIFSDGQPFFPIGIYNARNPAALAGTGFNSVVASNVTRGYLDACESVGIRVWPELTGVMRGHLPWQVGAAIAPLKDHPAIFGWYLCDEPDHAAWTVAPMEMRLATRFLKRADPLHPTWTVVMAWADSNLYQYADSVDILGTDVYPIEESSRQPLVTVAEKTDVLQKAVAGEKPVILVTQASTLVRPADEYALTYLAVTHGANGIFYWEFPEAVENPAHWSTLCSISRELQALSPVLTVGEARAATVSSGKIHAMSRRLGNRIYVIAVNEGPEGVGGVEFVDRDAADGPVQVLFERRNVVSSGRKWRDNFRGYERHVYSVPVK